MSIRYGSKVGPLVTRRSSFFKKDRFDHLRIKRPTSTSTPATWTRPADWLTMPTITSTEQKIALLMPVYPQGSNFLAFTLAGAYTVNWGDGDIESVASGVKAQHEYSYADPDLNTTVTSDGYKMAIVVITPQSGQNITSVNFNQKYALTGSTFPDSSPILEIIFSCPNLTSFTLGSTTTANVFCKNLVNFSAINMGLLTNFDSIFAGLISLKNISFNTISSAVTNMSSMFSGCSSLVSVPLFNTAAVTNMSSMFQSCRSLVSVPLFNTAAVTNMGSMFSGCSFLVSVPLFNTGAVTGMNNMFQSCTALTTVPLFNTAAVTSMSSMFQSCTALTTVPLFNTAAVTNMGSMFSGCSFLVSVPLFNTSAVTNMNSMFQNCTALTTVPLFNTGAVTNMSLMFQSCTALTTVPLFNTGAVTGMIGMFQSCTALTTVPLFNTGAVTNMSSMFAYCAALTTVPLFNTSAVTDMNNMFQSCTALTTVPLFNTGAVTNMSSMFASSSALTTVPLFNTAAVTNMGSMFQNCTALTNVPLFNTAAVTNMGSMFNGCSSLVSVPLFNTIAVNNMASMFNGCSSLVSVPLFNTAAVTGSNMGSIFNACPALTRGALNGTRATVSYGSCKLSKEELESIFNSLGTTAAGPSTIIVGSNWGVSASSIQTAATTLGSTTITMSTTSGIAVGMQVTGTGSPLTTAIAVSFTDTGDLVTLANHGLSNGDEVSFASITSTTGIVINRIYYVVSATPGIFQVAATLGGPALSLTTNGTGTLRYRTEVLSIVTNTSVTVSRPMTVTNGTTSLTFRQLKTGTALLKGWTVSPS
jgi:surface protein